MNFRSVRQFKRDFLTRIKHSLFVLVNFTRRVSYKGEEVVWPLWHVSIFVLSLAKYIQNMAIWNIMVIARKAKESTEKRGRSYVLQCPGKFPYYYS